MFKFFNVLGILFTNNFYLKCIELFSNRKIKLEFIIIMLINKNKTAVDEGQFVKIKTKVCTSKISIRSIFII